MPPAMMMSRYATCCIAARYAAPISSFFRAIRHTPPLISLRLRHYDAMLIAATLPPMIIDCICRLKERRATFAFHTIFPFFLFDATPLIFTISHIVTPATFLFSPDLRHAACDTFTTLRRRHDAITPLHYADAYAFDTPAPCRRLYSTHFAAISLILLMLILLLIRLADGDAATALRRYCHYFTLRR